MTFARRGMYTLVLLACGLAMNVPAAVGQGLANSSSSLSISSNDPRPTDAQLLEDFIHYVLIGRVDLADSSARALLDSGISDQDLYRLVDELELREKLDDQLIRAQRIDALAGVAAELENRIISGRLSLSRDPSEIERSINNLVASARARMMARDALVEAGEYAVPQMLEIITGTASRAMKVEARSMLIRIRRHSVTPLSVALPLLEPVAQERVCGILGEIGYRHARPALFALANDQAAETKVREAAEHAYLRLRGDNNNTSTEASLWLGMAEAYWQEQESLIAWPNEQTNNVWSYRAGVGLIATSVPTEIYCEVMAMSATEHALAAQADNPDALSLWVAANFRRLDELGGRNDPTYTLDRRPPLYYAVAAGPSISQMVLARANRDINSQLARHAIQSLAGTAGGSNLWLSGAAPTPLIESLEFPERRVRFDAALALGAALPDQPFAGADRVVPVLASVIQTGGRRFAAVVADSDEDQRTLAAKLRAMGYSVLPPRDNYDSLRGDLAQVVGVDLTIVKQAGMRVGDTVRALQSNPRLAATPVLLIVDSADETATRLAYEGDRRIGVIRSSATDDQMTNVIDEVTRLTMGPLMSPQEARDYTAAALKVLRDIAVKNSAAFDLTAAQGALIEALDRFSGEMRMTAAESLSWMGTAPAQQTLIDAGLREVEPLIQVLLLEFASDSARRFGSLANDRAISRLTIMLRDARGPVATAIAQLHGALNLPVANMVPMVLEKR